MLTSASWRCLCRVSLENDVALVTGNDDEIRRARRYWRICRENAKRVCFANREFDIIKRDFVEMTLEDKNREIVAFNFVIFDRNIIRHSPTHYVRVSYSSFFFYTASRLKYSLISLEYCA